MPLADLKQVAELLQVVCGSLVVAGPFYAEYLGVYWDKQILASTLDTTMDKNLLFIDDMNQKTTQSRVQVRCPEPLQVTRARPRSRLVEKLVFCLSGL